MTTTAPAPELAAPPSRPAGSNGPGRRSARWLFRHPRARLAALLTLPALWLVVAYLGALAALLVTSLYTIDDFTTSIIHELSFENFRTILTVPVYRDIIIRSVVVAASVTIIDIAIALPMAYFMAKVVRPGLRRAMLALVLMPLWASYLVKAYAWRAILDPASGVLESTFGWSPGFGITSVVIVLSYLWLPYMILPIYAGLERLPNSLLEASSDLGGKAGRTFRSVVVPLLIPSIVAGSIFTFSLSLGDYIAVGIVGGTTQMIGNVVARDFGANNVPFAAALSVIPVIIMLIYLALAKRTGAFEEL
jgi:putative spermidine/putrescine transport system permease protein